MNKRVANERDVNKRDANNRDANMRLQLLLYISIRYIIILKCMRIYAQYRVFVLLFAYKKLEKMLTM